MGSDITFPLVIWFVVSFMSKEIVPSQPPGVPSLTLSCPCCRRGAPLINNVFVIPIILMGAQRGKGIWAENLLPGAAGRLYVPAQSGGCWHPGPVLRVTGGLRVYVLWSLRGSGWQQTWTGPGFLLAFPASLPCEGTACDHFRGLRLPFLSPFPPAVVPYSSFSCLERLQSPQTLSCGPVMTSKKIINLPYFLSSLSLQKYLKVNADITTFHS